MLIIKYTPHTVSLVRSEKVTSFLSFFTFSDDTSL